MIRAWVIGAGGMLGSAIAGKLKRQGVDVYRYNDAFEWGDVERIRAQFDQAIMDFFGGLLSGDSWEIYWAAGVGAMGSSKTALADETVSLATFLSLLRSQMAVKDICGSLGFASSAGALYSGCLDFEITELSTITTLTDYAKAKAGQERLLKEFVDSVTGVELLISRFSTLFGPGQSLGKQQGLLSHIARCALRNKPVEVFVPLDTSRDYLFSDDAANEFISSLRTLRTHKCRFRAKIIAAEQSVTISEVLSIFNRLLKKQVRVVCNRNSMSSLYAPRVSYRSLYPHHVKNELQRHTLLEGIANLLSAERLTYLAGRHAE